MQHLTLFISFSVSTPHPALDDIATTLLLQLIKRTDEVY